MFAFHLREAPLIEGDRLTSTDSFTLRHLWVARIRPDEEFVLIHDGTRMVCMLIRLTAGELEARVLKSHRPPLRKVQLVMALGVLAGTKLDNTLFALTQLGVDAFVMFQGRRSTQRHGDWSSRVKRWERKILDACEISDMVNPPEVLLADDVADLAQVASSVVGENAHRLLFYEAAGQDAEDLKEWLKSPYDGEAVLGVVGPEGGFEREEVEALIASGFKALSLGERILEARVAAYFIASLLSAWIGKLG